jgi:superfamily II DNA or RNA helicase
MKRSYSNSEKSLLYRLAKGKCQLCQCDLPRFWHADHVIPFSKGGITALSNAQALCPTCNLKKSNKMFQFTPREWQIEATKKFYEEIKFNNVFLLHAGVGSGKTLWASSIIKYYIDRGYDVVIFSPKDAIKIDWALECKKFGIELDIKLVPQYTWKPTFDGVSLCYQVLKNNTNSLKEQITNKTIVVLDEHHHASDSGSWGMELENICENAGVILCLTGTPFRSDNNKIPFVKYLKTKSNDIDGWEIATDYSYTYAQSVKDRICCPTSFRPLDIIVNGVNKQLNSLDDKKYLNQILDASNTNSNFINTSFKIANKELQDIRNSYFKDAKGLIVANSIDDAKIIYSNLQKQNISCSIITSDSDATTETIKEFRDNNKHWVVTVQMVSEGVNIPQIRVILYLNNITTRTYFEQVMGRGVRNCKYYGDTIDQCIFYYPNYILFYDLAQTLEAGYKHFVIEENERIKNTIYNKDVIKPVSKEIDTLFDIIDGGGFGIINNGYKFTEQELSALKTVRELHYPSANTFENMIARHIPRNINNENIATNFIEEKPKYEKIEIIKKEIHKRVGYAIKLGVYDEYGIAHYNYNEAANIKDHKTCNDLRLLTKKLNLINDDINNYAKN